MSREGALVLNNLFLSVGAALVLVGTVTPMFAQALNISLSIGEPYFLLTFAPMMAILLIFMPLAPASTWQRTELSPLLKQFWPAAAVGAAAFVAVFVLRGNFWQAFGVMVGAWVVVGTGLDLARRAGAGGIGRLFRLPLNVWGMAIAHVGIGLFAIGAVTEAAARETRTFPLSAGQSVQFEGWTFRFDGTRQVAGPNYEATRGDIFVTHEDGSTETIHPEKRFYQVAETATTEVAIRKTMGGDMYVNLGDTIREQPGVWRIQITHHPLIDLVFGGPLLIALGGFFALAGRIRRKVQVTEIETPPAAEPKPDAATAGAPA